MNKFYTQTLIPLPDVDYKSIWPNDPTDSSDMIPRWQTYTSEKPLWNNTIDEMLALCDLKPKLIRIFRWAPKTIFPWHVDGTTEIITEFAINWVYEGSGIIQWNSKLELPKPEANHSHLAFGSKQGGLTDVFESKELGHGCIVNTTIPHRVVNVEPIHRITVSIQFGNDLTYAQAVEKLTACGLIKGD